MFSQPSLEQPVNQDVFLFVDPAAGGATSDYAILSVARHKGIITVSPPAHVDLGRGQGALHRPGDAADGVEAEPREEAKEQIHFFRGRRDGFMYSSCAGRPRAAG